MAHIDFCNKILVLHILEKELELFGGFYFRPTIIGGNFLGGYEEGIGLETDDNLFLLKLFSQRNCSSFAFN